MTTASTGARTIDEMVAKGRAKLVRKIPAMSANYDRSKDRAVTNYNALPFGPQTKAAYASGLRDARFRAPDPEKWARNFRAGVTR